MGNLCAYIPIMKVMKKKNKNWQVDIVFNADIIAKIIFICNCCIYLLS